MTWGAGGIDTKMEVCPLSSEVQPSVHSTILHLHACATISLPCATIYRHHSLVGRTADLVFFLWYLN